MENNIILQQLQLHFGDNFDELYANTRSYVKGLIAKPWWIDRGALVTSEGPLSRMVEDCLAHVVDKGDKVEGWQAYTSLLTGIYGSASPHAKAVAASGDAMIESTNSVWSTYGSYNAFVSPLSDTTGVEEQVSDELTLFNERQADFIAVYSTMGASAAAEEFNITQEQARNRRNTIKRTVLRRLGKGTS